MYRVKAIYDYSSPHEDDLSFDLGQVITVTEEEDADWLVGEYTDATGSKKSGLFPKNFVEKFEPEPPPRPARSTRPKQIEPVAPAAPAAETIEQEEDDVQATSALPTQRGVVEEEEPKLSSPVAAKSPQESRAAPEHIPPPAESVPEPVAAQKPTRAPSTSKPAGTIAGAKQPPPVVEKPSSFKDRIAAFNKPAAAPVAPFKPSGPSTGFIKKPFVAPPPSRNAYVPPPQREVAPQKIYRRDEDPEIAERQARDQEAAEKAGLATTNTEEQDEDAPKPTSLKERIALLQKQQLEQAKRAEASAKEKPKKPPKKRTESQEPTARHEEASEVDGAGEQTLERVSSDHSSTRAAPIPRTSIDRTIADTSSAREVLSDANDADQSAAGETTEDAGGESTSVEDEAEPQRPAPPHLPIRTASHQEYQQAPKEIASSEDEEEEEDEMDAETRRRMELRERMAKMSGGMGMAGMFGPSPGLPMGGSSTKKKKSVPVPEQHEEVEDRASQPPPVRVPMIPVPGMASVRSPEVEDRQLDVEKEDEPQRLVTAQRHPDEIADLEDVEPQRSERGAPPPIPAQHPTSPPAVTSPPITGGPTVQSPSAGSESDDEMPGDASRQASRAPPPAVPAAEPSVERRSVDSQRSPQTKRTSTLGSETFAAPPVASTSDKRASRAPPPIPVASIPTSPGAARPPPPPPPTAAPPSRRDTNDDVGQRGIDRSRADEETEYEGDYDTDIAAGADHKDALKAHGRNSSFDGDLTADEAPNRPQAGPPAIPPPVPSSSRPLPPPPPQQAPPPRQSVDAPRIAPPPVPPPAPSAREDDDDDYDPYKYHGSPPVGAPPSRAPAPLPPRLPPAQPPPAPIQQEEESDDELYSQPTPRDERPPPVPAHEPPMHHDRAAPPPPPQSMPHSYAPPPVPAEPPAAPPPTRKSLDANRAISHVRKSMDQPRPSSDLGFVATDIDLSVDSQWWAQPNAPPPVFRERKDILYEMEESTSSKRGGKTEVSKDVYILFHDYSQTIVTARFDAQNVGDVSLEQRHEGPPPKLRQDQLEDSHARFGARLADAVNAKQGSVVGDGTPHGLITGLYQSLPGALPPIGTRAYGALVYANLANATQQQFDEIRPGDIITFRNARFEGKHGAMHAKYKLDLGREHVGIVHEWDGTKKKVRAFEQGRESKKCKSESFRVGDLRSGEVKVWRIMSRAWVGWDDGK